MMTKQYHVRKGRLLLCATPLALVLLGGARIAAQDAAFDVSEARSMLREWVKTKQLVSREKQKSEQDLEVLKARLSLAEQRLERLSEQLQNTREKIESADNTHIELMKDKGTLQQAMGVLEERVGTLEARVRNLLEMSPEPLRRNVAALSQMIPDNPDETKRSVAERYQSLIGILSAMNSFSNELLVTTEVRDIGGGESVEVKVMYVGLGQGYFCNENGTIGGVGRVTSEGWTWTRQDDLAPAISNAIARYRNEKPADYDVLPVKLTTVGETSQ